ncbi:MAG: LPS assembly lipoprotein LptE [Sulfuricurvum sp.]|nr:LPS assembly lipoprotein LptE [Sulfuricurvum sp.]
MKVYLLFLPLFLLITGCGYLPASHYAKNVVGESVSTEVVISMEDPQNTVIIKDAVDTAMIVKFRTALVSKSSSQTHLKFQISSVTFTPLRYDSNGYVITYRTRVAMNIERISVGDKGNYTVSGVYDFNIEPNAIISDQARFEAIRFASQKAIDAFIAQVASQGTKSLKE